MHSTSVSFLAHSLLGVWNCKWATVFTRTMICMLWTMNNCMDFNQNFYGHTKNPQTSNLLENSIYMNSFQYRYSNWRKKKFMENINKRLSDLTLMNYELMPNKQGSSFITSRSYLCICHAFISICYFPATSLVRGVFYVCQQANPYWCFQKCWSGFSVC